MLGTGQVDIVLPYAGAPKPGALAGTMLLHYLRAGRMAMSCYAAPAVTDGS